MELFKASQQWATRPADQRFATLADAHQATLAYAKSAVESNPNPATLRAEVNGTDLVLVGKKNNPALLTNWAFGQLTRTVGAPANYLRKLPATLAAQNINHGLREQFGTAQNPRDPEQSVNLLMHNNGSLLVRSITSDMYTRIWNHEIIERLLPLREQGWTNPRPFNAKQESPAIYASDHDMFVFLVNDDRIIDEPGSRDHKGLGKGFFVSNSEVGAGALSITRFLYRYVCCNHIVWGAEDVAKAKIIHIGDLGGRMAKFRFELEKYANESVSDDVAKIKMAKSKEIAATKEDVLDFVFGKGFLTRKAAEASYDLAERNSDVDGNPRSIWGYVQGVTRYSQTLGYADERVAVERSAGRILQVAF